LNGSFFVDAHAGRKSPWFIIALGNLSYTCSLFCLDISTISFEYITYICKNVPALCVGGVAIVIIIILCLKWKLIWRKKPKYNLNVENFLKNQEFLDPKRYSYSQIKKMTNSFEIKLGQGGFGSVFKGVLSNQNIVVMMILNELKGNGKDFINEVARVGRTCHVNIVRLVGFCLEGHRRALIDL
jgi:hypothetical protein